MQTGRSEETPFSDTIFSGKIGPFRARPSRDCALGRLKSGISRKQIGWEKPTERCRGSLVILAVHVRDAILTKAVELSNWRWTTEVRSRAWFTLREPCFCARGVFAGWLGA
jgi:hypothetical protein